MGDFVGVLEGRTDGDLVGFRVGRKVGLAEEGVAEEGRNVEGLKDDGREVGDEIGI